MNPDPLPHMGRAGHLPCECEGAGTCGACKVRAAMTHLEKVYLDDTQRARAVHELIHAIKEAALK
jgi:hypothetical protein